VARAKRTPKGAAKKAVKKASGKTKKVTRKKPARKQADITEVVLAALKSVGLVTDADVDAALDRQIETGQTLSEVVLQGVHPGQLSECLSTSVKGPDGKPCTLRQLLVKAGWLAGAEEGLEQAKESGRKLAKILLDQGIITVDQLAEAFEEQAASGHTLSRALINIGVPVQKISDALATAEREEVTAGDRESRLGQILVDKKYITATQLEQFLEEAKDYGGAFEDFLLERGVINDTQLGYALAEYHNLEFVDLSSIQVDDQILELLPQTVIVENNAVPVSKEGRDIRVAFADPRNMAALENYAKITGLNIVPVLAARSKVAEVIDKHILSTFREEGTEVSATAVSAELIDKVGTANVPNLVASLVEGAINSRATDIHLDPSDSGMRVRYRIDGLLHDVMNLPAATGVSVTSRLKVMANMDIIERRHEQDGHINMEISGNVQDLRVSTIPTMHGEKVTVRIMSEENVLTGLSQLGFVRTQLDQVQVMIARPYGMILAAGPVGSGKTTTLYACLNKVNVLTKNVMTIEEPVEYKLRGTNQSVVDRKREFDFARGLRAILRQDPDIVMVGEIRDDETAQIATRAALTGVLVFSTIHGADAPSTVTTLFNHGIPGFIVSTALAGIVAQRLVRKICPACRVPYKPDPEVLKQLRLPAGEREAEDLVFYRGTGCPRCFHTGYSGRTGIFEVMLMDEQLRDLIFRQTTREVIRQVAIDNGMETLKQAAYEKVKEGITTVEELFRVVQA